MDFSPPSSIPTNHSTGVQVRAFPQLLPGSSLNPLRPHSGHGVDASSQLSSFPQVWIWDRVTRPPAGRTPSSCFSPSSSFSGCSVFELCLLSAHRQPEENQYWGSLLTLTPGPSPESLHFCWLRPTLATLQEGVGATSVHRVGEACALNGSLSSIVSPSCGRGGWIEENVCVSSLFYFPPDFLI